MAIKDNNLKQDNIRIFGLDIINADQFCTNVVAHELNPDSIHSTSVVFFSCLQQPPFPVNWGLGTFVDSPKL